MGRIQRPAARTRRAAAVIAGAALAWISMAAQQPPTFRSGVDLISIDVTVVDGDGAQVPTLGASDFAVDVDGRPRAVVDVQYFAGSGPVVPGSTRTAASRLTTPADAAANQIVLAVDVNATGPESRDQVLAAAGALLDRLPATDRVAVVALPLRITEVALTTNRELARSALQDLSGWSSRPGRQLPFGIVEALAMERGEREWQRAVERVCDRGDPFERDACRSNMESDARALVAEAASRALTSTTGLEALLRVLGRIEGPKTVLYFAEELPTDGARIEVGRVARAAAAARARIHVMHARPPEGDAANTFLRFEPVKERQRQLEGLELVSDWTGGDLFTLGAHQEIATRVARELSGRYLLLVETSPTDRDGKPHAVRVRVPGSPVTVRARREFVASNLRTTTTAPVDPVAAPADAPPDDALPAATRRARLATVSVTVDPLHPDRRSDETAEMLRQLRAALVARGFAEAGSPAEAAVQVELAGQRVLGGGRTALPGQGRGGSQPTSLVRLTVTAGDRMTEIRGRNQTVRDIIRSSADEAARLVERWLGEDAAYEPVDAPVAAPPASTVPPQELLPRMRAYVGEYEQALAGIVAEERYVQTYSQRVRPYPAPARLTQRVLRSEMGFAWFPAPGTWFGFRDVLEANGKPVGDRQQRLEDLFVERAFPSAEQLSRVAASSARFNIGPVRRNFNVPTMTLLVASPANAGRFAFELRGYDVVDGTRVAVIAFSETGSPTLITRDGQDWPSRGILWVEPESGRIWRTDLQLADRDLEMRHTTWFAPDERLGLMVPTRMRELYDYLERADEYVEALADYSNVRRFQVRTSGGAER